MIKRKLLRLKNEISLISFLIRNFKESRELSRLSVLDDRQKGYSPVKECPICKSNDIAEFARFPVNVPPGQNHSLLYFDYDKVDMDFIRNKKEVLDKTLGFFVSIIWNFCNNCKNASLSIPFKSEHMLEYYVNYYDRRKETDQLRRNTKELHGKFLSSLLPSQSTVFEIGAADGITAEYLTRHGYKVYVYEPSKKFETSLKQSKSIMYIAGYANLRENFDAIYLHHVFEHIPDPVHYLKELIPLLKKDGLILIQVPELTSQLRIIERVAKKSVYTVFNKPYFSIDMISCGISKESYNWFDALANDHITAYTVEGLSYVLQESGFAIEKIIQSTRNSITTDFTRYAWPVDEMTGNTPNGLTAIARKR